jgi:hypothetical protein
MLDNIEHVNQVVSNPFELGLDYSYPKHHEKSQQL